VVDERLDRYDGLTNGSAVSHVFSFTSRGNSTALAMP